MAISQALYTGVTGLAANSGWHVRYRQQHRQC